MPFSSADFLADAYRACLVVGVQQVTAFIFVQKKSVFFIPSPKMEFSLELKKKILKINLWGKEHYEM